MHRLRKVILSFSTRSFLLGLSFFAASLTPSLIPRGATEQGILGGVVIAIGYLLGQTLSLIWQAADLPRLQGRVGKTFDLLLALGVVALTGWILVYSLEWQNELRQKMSMVPVEGRHLIQLSGLTTLTFLILYGLGALIAALFHWVRGRFYRVMPPRRANVLGVLTVAAILFVVTRDGIFDRVVASLDQSYETAQELFDVAPPLPHLDFQSGSTTSLIDWAAMGQPGRDFVLSGPDAKAISAFTGKPAQEPLRVYVGRANGETPRERAELALAELIRVNAFEREVLIVTSPTGTGWMDPGSHDPVEYMHGGDIATVSVQYSYLQSPLALILETRTGLDQATALLEVVHEYWSGLPKDSRPRLYAHGLSLGAWSSMYATNLFRLLDDPINGAFWAGPPFPSRFWQSIQIARNTDSPWVLPEIGRGTLVRYANHVHDASEAPRPWGGMRIAFLQYSSDPIVFYDPRSLWRAPPWMNDPPAEDVSRHLVFIPIVTQFQLALDMALSFGAPPGHGHAYYARDYISPWAEVTAPKGWTRQDTQRLRAHCDLGVELGCRNK
ncbi:alpha/beta-hydrolase family protein [uncultured Shimia sp.]|uniref:alpha/beta hydrolase n=1 Tax=uncultured Shimia sp. TaxID=573152 RepID=UPI0025FCD318|nr:alpha/beta-hydrolase family protein [uncultured Shimia sp.]